MSARRLVARESLPERATSAERIARMESDVREAAQKVERRLRDYAQRYVVSGWTADEDSEWVMTGRTVVGTLVIRRSD